jgi:hypothetical protein
VWRKNIFDIYVTEYGTALTTILPSLFLYLLLQWQPEPLNRNESGRFGALKSDSTHLNKGNNKITELRTILQRENPNS